jgi:hypothetical protein
MRKKHWVTRRSKKRRGKKMRERGWGGKRRVRDSEVDSLLLLVIWELLKRHCTLGRGLCLLSNRCRGLIVILTVCSRKVQTLICTITLLKYGHLPLFSHT